MMINLRLLTVLLLGLSSFDGGDCIRIKAAFELEDETIIGYAHTSRIDLIEDLENNQMEKLIDYFLYTSAGYPLWESITVYEQLDILQFKRMIRYEGQYIHSGYLYHEVSPARLHRTISTRQIIEALFINYFPCRPSDGCSPQYRGIVGGGPIVITELNEEEIEILSSGSPREMIVIVEQELQNTHLVSLHRRHLASELEKRYQELAEGRTYEALKQELRKQGIVMFCTYSIA